MYYFCHKHVKNILLFFSAKLFPIKSCFLTNISLHKHACIDNLGEHSPYFFDFYSKINMEIASEISGFSDCRVLLAYFAPSPDDVLCNLWRHMFLI